MAEANTINYTCFMITEINEYLSNECWIQQSWNAKSGVHKFHDEDGSRESIRTIRIDTAF